MNLFAHELEKIADRIDGHASASRTLRSAAEYIRLQEVEMSKLTNIVNRLEAKLAASEAKNLDAGDQATLDRFNDDGSPIPPPATAATVTDPASSPTAA